MKRFFLCLFILFAGPICAQTIDLHLECGADKANCVEMKDGKGSSYLLERNLALTIDDSTLADVWLDQGEIGQTQLRIELNSKTKKAFADLTGDNIGKVLALVYKGNVITAPVIKERISAGSLTLTHGLDGSPVWEQIPWLKQRLEASARGDYDTKKAKLAVLILVACGVVGGGVWYAFRRPSNLHS